MALPGINGSNAVNNANGGLDVSALKGNDNVDKSPESGGQGGTDGMMQMMMQLMQMLMQMMMQQAQQSASGDDGSGDSGGDDPAQKKQSQGGQSIKDAVVNKIAGDIEQKMGLGGGGGGGGGGGFGGGGFGGGQAIAAGG